MCVKPKDTYEEPFAEFEEQEQRDALGKGLFWLVKNDEEKFELFCIKILCYRDGETLERVETGVCENEKLNHKRAWAKLDKQITQGKAYNYYPRGRVGIRRGKATIFMNPILHKKEILEKIITSIGLTMGNGLTHIRVKHDSSYHYRFLIEQ